MVVRMSRYAYDILAFFTGSQRFYHPSGTMAVGGSKETFSSPAAVRSGILGVIGAGSSS